MSKETTRPPDGASLLLAGQLPGENESRLWISPAAGGATDGLHGLAGSQGAWSTDGSRLVFARGNALYIAAADGSGQRKLVDTGDGPHWIRWSPDGRYIAAVSSDQERNFPSLWLYNVKKRKWTLMAKMSGINEPAWVSRSDYIYFATPLSSDDPGLYRIRIHDRKLERLGNLKPNPQGEMWTGVTPDGSPLIARNAASEEVYALSWKLGK